MTEISRSALLPYPSEDLFSLVNDVETYPKYLPWCADATIHERAEDSVVASMTLSKSGITKVVKTRNTLEPPKKMHMELLQGPFKQFEGWWTFEALNETATKVTLELKFEFEKTLFGKMIAPLFNQVGTKLLDAFCQHARQRLGDAPDES